MIYSGRKIVFIPGDSIRVTQPAAAAIIPWYLSGGISAANCIAAYQAKGAASQAASYVNLASPGTYDLGVGSAPSWDASIGWTFADTHYLTHAITLNSPLSIAVRLDTNGASINGVAGKNASSGGSSHYLNMANTSTQWRASSSAANFFNNASVGSGTDCVWVFTLADGACVGYKDGSSQTGGGTGLSQTQIIQHEIGRFWANNDYAYNGVIVAIAFYDAAIDAAASALSTAMAAL